MKRLVLVLCVTLVACGGKSGGNGDDTPGDDAGGGGDDAGGGGDGGPGTNPPGCTGPVPGNPQCSNCIDDDGDGYIDSFDI